MDLRLLDNLWLLLYVLDLRLLDSLWLLLDVLDLRLLDNLWLLLNVRCIAVWIFPISKCRKVARQFCVRCAYMAWLSSNWRDGRGRQGGG